MYKEVLDLGWGKKYKTKHIFQIREIDVLTEASKRLPMPEIVKLVRKVSKKYKDKLKYVWGGGEYWDQKKDPSKLLRKYHELKKSKKDRLKEKEFDELNEKIRKLAEEYAVIDIDLLLVFDDGVPKEEMGNIAKEIKKELNERLEEVKKDNLIYEEKFCFDIDSRDLMSENEMLHRIGVYLVSRICEKDKAWIEKVWKRKEKKYGFSPDMGDTYGERVLLKGKGVLLFDNQTDEEKRNFLDFYKRETGILQKGADEIINEDYREFLRILYKMAPERNGYRGIAESKIKMYFPDEVLK